MTKLIERTSRAASGSRPVWLAAAMAAVLTGSVATAIVAFPTPAFARDYLAEARQALAKGDLKAAQIQLRNAVRDDPQNAAAHFELARVSLQLNDPTAAEREARAALERGYDPSAATQMLAQIYLGQGRGRDLLRDIKVTGTNPELDAQILVSRGIAHLSQNEPVEAEKDFTDAQHLAPKAVEPLLAQSRLAMVQRDLPKARAKVDEALALDPHSADALLRKAEIQRNDNDPAAALGTLEKLLSENPSLISARLERAGLLIATGKDDLAKKDVDNVLTALPNSLQGTFLRALLLARAKDFAGADALLDKIGSSAVNLPRAFYLQALVKQSLGQLEQAEDAAVKWVSRAPTEISGLKLLAGIQLAKREPDRAVETLSKLVQGPNADEQSYDLIARAYAATGRQKEAVEYFEKAAALAPNDASLRQRLAASHMGAGDADSAINDLQKSFDLAPKEASSGAALFFADLATGDLVRSTKTLEKIRQAQGDTPVVRNMEGLLQLANLDQTAAQKTFEKLSNDQPDFVPAKINLARIAMMQGRTADADAILNGILKTSPVSEPALTMAIASLTQQKRFVDAIGVMTRAHEAAPKDSKLTAALADYYSRANDPAKALEFIAGLGKDADTNPDLIAAKARASIALKKPDDAQTSLRALVAADPKNIDARRALASLMVDSGNIESARGMLEAGMKIAPHNYQLMSDYVAIDLKSGGGDKAVATAVRLATNASDFPEARLLKGDIYVTEKKYSDAVAAYSDVLKTNPSTVVLMRIVGAQMAGGQKADALRTMSDWLAKNPDDVIVAQSLAGVELTDRQYADAAKRYEHILSKSPRDPIALNNLAWLYQQTGDKRAKDLAERAYLLRASPQSADTLGWILTTEGNPAKGLLLLRQADGEGFNPSIRYHLAVALRDTGDKAGAVKLLTSLTGDDVQFDEKDKATKLLQDLSKS